MAEQHTPWKTLSSRIVYRSPWLTLHEDEVIKPNGEPGTYVYTESPPFVMVMAYDDPAFIMIRQYRYPLHQAVIEFPGGSIDGDEDPLDAAKREFKEETGFTAALWTKLGAISSPNHATIFLAQELTDSHEHQMADDGIESYVHLTSDQINIMIDNGEITDAKMMAAMRMFERFKIAHPEAF